jgi:hypothetical protein
LRSFYRCSVCGFFITSGLKRTAEAAGHHFEQRRLLRVPVALLGALSLAFGSWALALAIAGLVVSAPRFGLVAILSLGCAGLALVCCGLAIYLHIARREQ